MPIFENGANEFSREGNDDVLQLLLPGRIK
jgi:hypothetical protein